MAVSKKQALRNRTVILSGLFAFFASILLHSSGSDQPELSQIFTRAAASGALVGFGVYVASQFLGHDSEDSGNYEVQDQAPLITEDPEIG